MFDNGIVPSRVENPPYFQDPALTFKNLGRQLRVQELTGAERRKGREAESFNGPLKGRRSRRYRLGGRRENPITRSQFPVKKFDDHHK